jgi:hypothetical protein
MWFPFCEGCFEAKVPRYVGGGKRRTPNCAITRVGFLWGME